jgi:hypothetical protein
METRKSRFHEDYFVDVMFNDVISPGEKAGLEGSGMPVRCVRHFEPGLSTDRNPLSRSCISHHYKL